MRDQVGLPAFIASAYQASWRTSSSVSTTPINFWRLPSLSVEKLAVLVIPRAKVVSLITICPSSLRSTPINSWLSKAKLI